MQTGMKAGLAIVLAVFLTGIVGFLTAVTPEDEERIYYNQVSDLTPIIDYTAIDSYTEYNPITNVSGWSDKTGVIIPFIDNGISAYPYRYYAGTTTGPTYSASYVIPAMMGIIGANPGADVPWEWYPVGEIYTIPSQIGSTTYYGVDISRISDGHILLENAPGSGVNPPQTHTFAVNLQHLNEDREVVHQFTYLYYGRTSEGVVSSDRTISSLNAFDNTLSEKIILRATNNGADIADMSLDIDVTLPTGHVLVGYIMSMVNFIADPPSMYIHLPNNTVTSGISASSLSNYGYNGGMNWDYVPSDFSTLINENLKLCIRNNISIDGSIKNTSIDSWQYMPLSQLISRNTNPIFNEGDTLTITNRILYYGNVQHQYGRDGPIYNSTWNASFNTYSAERISYYSNDGLWYPSILSENGLYWIPDVTKTGHSLDNIYVVEQGLSPTISVQHTGIEYAYDYVDPNQFVTIANGVTATWKNYMDRTIGNEITTAYYNNGQIILLTEPGTVISSDNVFWKDDGGNVTRGTMQLTVPTSVPYSMALVTLDFQGGQFYAQGVVWGAIDVSDRNTSNWTLRPHQYPITPSFSEGGSPSYVQGLSFTKTGGTKVFIVSTNVQTDPMGRLWGDPSVYLGYYFPDYFQYDATTGNTGVPTTAIRVLFNGFVSYGTSFTINGQTMPISDGEISFTYYTYETAYDTSTNPPTEYTETITNTATKPIKGMAVDWEDGHVYLVFTEQGKTRYDLGEYDPTSVNVIIADADTGKDTVATDVISGTGTWYWQANLYTIHHKVETVLHLDLSKGLGGWGMSLQVSMLLFVAMLIVGVAIVHYYYRESDEPMGILDWIIIGLAILLSLGVAML